MGKPFEPLILASGSPRRAEILRRVGIPFDVVVPRITEANDRTCDTIEARAEEVALMKAESVSLHRPGRIVLGADTLVVCENEVFGKPKTEAEAAGMLERLSGRDHFVVTGIALCRKDGEFESATGCESTVVTFKSLSQAEIRRYVATGESLDKAGGYGIQGKGAFLIKRIAGCYFNVVGLPISRLYDMLRRWGYEPFG